MQHLNQRLLLVVVALCGTLGCEETAPDAAEVRETWSKPSIATTADLTAVDLLGNGRGTIVGDTGTIFATTDKGVTWKKQTCPIKSDLSAVREWTNGDAVAATTKGEILMRRDSVWYVVAYAPNATPLHAIGFSGNAIYVMGGGFRLNDVYAVVVRSPDGGRNWEAVHSLSDRLFMWVKALDDFVPDRMLVVGKCYPPGNCPSNIQYVIPSIGSITTVGLTAFGTPEDVAMTASGVGLVAGTKLCRTTNGGLIWTTVRQQQPSPSTGVALYSSGFGVLIGAAGSVEATFDAGLTWNKQPTGATRDLRDVSIGDASSAIIVGDAGTVIRWGK